MGSRLLWLSLGALLLLTCSGTAQQGTIVAAGYSIPPRIFPVVAGQIITVYASGVGQSLTNGVVATHTPLPTSLGGISATLILTPGGSVPMPILAVLPIQCGEPPPCSNLIGVTLQIPFEIGVPNPLPIGPPVTPK